jgi:FdrA protein
LLTAGVVAGPGTAGPAERRQRTLVEAVAEDQDANLAVISTPGAYAAAEALKALRLGLNVFLFSDNVPLADEVMLKREAHRRGLLVMGPDCGTAIVNGVPLAFANDVRAGDVGLIGASGTGLQQVSSLIDRAGSGITQVIGVGSHDLSEEVGAISMLAALDALAADPATRVIVLVSKPPASSVAERVLVRAAATGKPVVASFLGSSLEPPADSIHVARTLEEAARLAVALSRGAGVDDPLTVDPAPIVRDLGEGRRYLRALYSGGTFAYEARLLLGPVQTSLGHPATGHVPELPAAHLVLDLGDDEFTVGRPHPMIDPSLRVQLLRAAAAAPDTAAILLDVVIGHGAAPDPAVPLAEVIQAARSQPDGGPTVIAFVCGTAADPQGLERQESLLREAGAVLAPSSTAAARLAAAIVEAAQEWTRS